MSQLLESNKYDVMTSILTGVHCLISNRVCSLQSNFRPKVMQSLWHRYFPVGQYAGSEPTELRATYTFKFNSQNPIFGDTIVIKCTFKHSYIVCNEEK